MSDQRPEDRAASQPPLDEPVTGVLSNGEMGTHSSEMEGAEGALRESERYFQEMIDALPEAIYITDADGRLTYFNSAAVEFSGRTPELGTDQWCVTWQLYWPDGTPMPHDECPMAVAMKEGHSIRGAEAIAERPDGTRKWFEAYPSPLRDDDGEIVGGINMLVDVTERKAREQRLERQREQIEQLKDRLLDTSPTGILFVNEAGEITLANERAADILGRAAEDLTGLAHNAPTFEFVDANGEPLSDGELPIEQVRTAGEAVFGMEVGATRPDGQRVWLSMNAAPLYDDHADESTETVVALEEITERKQTTEALDHLNTASRDLMNADGQTISDRAASLAHDVLDVEYTVLYHYDSAAGDLRRHTTSTAPEIDQGAIQSPDGFEERAWQAFISNEIDVSTDLAPADSATAAEPLHSEVIIPLGRHGVIYAGSLQPESFDDTMIDLAATVGATIATTLDRAEHEQQLEHKNTELTQLNRLNTIIRTIDQGLVQAETREEIDQLVCECFAASERYEFAWIGATEPGTDTVTPREWAGVASDYLEDVEITTDETPTGQGPVGAALRTHEPQVVADIVTEARFAPWREQTLDRGVRSCISVPLCYEDSLYGVLTVYTETPQPNDRETAVLAELGETIGHAINAVETKRTLQTDSVVELSLQLGELDTVLASLAQQTACTIEFEGLVPHADDAPTIFFTVHGASADEIHRYSTDAISIASVTCLTEREDSCRFKARIGGTTLAAAFIAEDAVIRSLTIEATTVSAVVDVAQAEDVRPFVERLQSQFPSIDLCARRTRERSLTSEQDIQTAFEDRLTNRQQEVLRTAYLSGFFESPRGTTGQEVAEAMDVSQPTFVQHLRAGQRNLFEMLFDGIA